MDFANTFPKRPWHLQASGATTYFWVRLRYTHPGDVIRMIYRDPGGAVYDDQSATVTVFRGMDKARWTTALPLVGGLGTWTVEFQINGVQVATKSFVYDAVDYQIPVGLGRTVPVLYGVAAGGARGRAACCHVGGRRQGRGAARVGGAAELARGLP